LQLVSLSESKKRELTMAPPIATPSTVVPLFQPAPKATFTADSKLQSALNGAISALKDPSVPISIVDLGATVAGGASFRFAGASDDEEDYIASEAKVGILYAAYVFRDMVRRFNSANAPTNQADLFKQLRDTMTPMIVAAVPRVLGGTVPSSHRLPSYEKVLTTTQVGGSLVVDFRTDFSKSLDDMIIPSDNNAARQCVHGLGFSYLNGALAAGGFFDDSTGRGVWVGGDFQMGHDWAPVRIATVNDGNSSVASTTSAMVRLIVSIVTTNVLDTSSCDDMNARLKSAAAGPDQPWLTRTALVPTALVIPRSSVTHNKLGLGPLNSGGDVFSEGSVLSGLGRNNYAVSWQNLTPGKPSQFADVAAVIRKTIGSYEATP
jgi:hypothetical protein